jgi:hypothetical protein
MQVEGTREMTPSAAIHGQLSVGLGTKERDI